MFPGLVGKYNREQQYCRISFGGEESVLKLDCDDKYQFSRSVMPDSATPWIAACQASLSITNSWSILKLKSIKSVMPSNHLILCHPFLLMPSIFPNIRVYSNEWNSSLHQVDKILEFQLQHQSLQ